MTFFFKYFFSKLFSLRNIFLFINFLLLFSVFFRLIYNWQYFGHEDYGITEWLINYQGGFIRRGLPGEILFTIWNKFGLKANILAILLSAFFYIFLLIYLIIKTKDKFPIELIISSVLMGMPIFSQWFVRKDILGIIFLIICLKIFDLKLNKFYSFVTINLVGILALLSHEAFFFYALMQLIFFNYSQKVQKKKYKFYINFTSSVIFFLPSIMIFIFILYKTGNPEVGRIINDSWRNLWILIEPNHCCVDQVSATFKSLELSLKNEINHNPAYWRHSYLNGLVWILIIFLCYYFLISFKYIKDANFSNILLFQFLCIFPLFVVGVDWGRWIFYWTTSSVIFYLFDFNLKRVFFFSYLNKISKYIVYSKIMTCKNYWILLFFGVPITMHTTLLWHFTSSPIGKLITIIMKLLGIGLKTHV